MGQPFDWDQALEEAACLLREGGYIFDVSDAYDLVSLDGAQDGGADDDMPDLERHLQEGDSDDEDDGSLPTLLP
jgi:hypothetical protein